MGHCATVERNPGEDIVELLENITTENFGATMNIVIERILLNTLGYAGYFMDKSRRPCMRKLCEVCMTKREGFHHGYSLGHSLQTLYSLAPYFFEGTNDLIFSSDISVVRFRLNNFPDDVCFFEQNFTFFLPKWRELIKEDFANRQEIDSST